MEQAPRADEFSYGRDIAHRSVKLRGVFRFRRPAEAGADGISVVNTIPGSIQRNGLPRLGNGSGGLSGPALLPVGLLAVQKVKALLPHVPVIGVGGVRSTDDVRQYLSAGASLVAIGTAQLADPRLPQRIVAELMSHG